MSRSYIRDLPHTERPYYRLQAKGAHALSDIELLSMILGTPDALQLAQELLCHFGSLHRLARASAKQLQLFRGVGHHQAARLQALVALSYRLQMPERDDQLYITSPEDATKVLMPIMRHLKQEELHVVFLNTRNAMLGMATIYRGNVNSAVIRLAELFLPAIEANAVAIIVAHNHPSGDPTPSTADIQITRQIDQAGELLGIELLDHLIIGAGRYVSLKERGVGFEGKKS